MPTARLLLAVLLAFALVPAVPRQADAAATLPDGFRLEPVATGQAEYDLSSIAFVPAGMLTLGLSGTVTFVPSGGEPRVVGQVPGVLVKGDIGAIGLAVGPDFATTGTVFIAYSYATGAGMVGRVSRWSLSPPSAPTSMAGEQVLLDGIRLDVAIHGLGTLAIGPDGSLLVGMGDASSASFADARSRRAQDLTQPHGKILRIDPTTGAGRADNPFFDPAAPASWRSRVYAYGLRNPFRFALDPSSGALVAGDVGWRSWEEVDRILPGGNYGWPCYEGPSKVSGHTSAPVCTQLYARSQTVVTPLVTYPHVAGEHASVTGGTWYTGDSYPEAYRNAYVYGDYARQMLWTLRLDDAGRVEVPPQATGFGREVGSPVDIKSGPNGDVYFADNTTGLVQRLRYAPGNRRPVAVVDTTVDADTRTVTFDAGRSYDLDGDELTYAWVFGDGATAEGRTVTHAYADPVTYEVSLTVTDELAAVGVASARVVPDNHAPQVVLDAPPSTSYAVGQPVALTASATDAEDGALTVEWKSLLFHCPGTGACHVHPGEGGTGPEFATDFADHGEDTHLRVVASAVDSAGVTTEVEYEARPTLRTLTVLAPVPVSINGEQRVSARVVVGSTNVVSLPVTSGHFQLVSRSDGGSAEQAMTMPDSDVEITAVYETAIDARHRSLGPTSFLGAPTGPELDVGVGRTRPYVGGDIYWSAGTGAYWVKGAIRTHYGVSGGVAQFGFPTSDELVAAGGGRESRFQRATFYWSRSTGARFVQGDIRTKFLATGGVAGSLGYPTADHHRIVGGAIGRFQRGDIYWSRATGAHTMVAGAIKTRWLALGAHRGRLGFPRTDRLATSYGRIVRFEGGAIRWRKASRTVKVTYT